MKVVFRIIGEEEDLTDIDGNEVINSIMNIQKQLYMIV
jgi:hypothetical protein